MKLIFDTEKKITKTYIKGDDVLLARVGSPKKISEPDAIEIADGLIIIHYNGETNEITGFTCPYVEEMIEDIKK